MLSKAHVIKLYILNSIHYGIIYYATSYITITVRYDFPITNRTHIALGFSY